MKRNHTNIIFILSIIATISVVCLFVFFLKVIRNKNEHVSAVLITLAEKMREKENVIMFSEKSAEIQATRDSVNGRFVDPDKIDTFVGYLEDLNKNIGGEISVKSIEIMPKTKNTISIKLLVKGNFQEVTQTIYLLENIPYQVNFTQVNINKDIEQPVAEEEKNVHLKIPTWQADVAFNILTL